MTSKTGASFAAKLVLLQKTLGGIYLFAALIVLGAGNGLTRAVADSIAAAGWGQAALGTFDVSILTLAALAAIVALIAEAPWRPLDRRDLACAGVVTAAFLVPDSHVSWAALSGLALYLILRGGKGALRGAGIVLLALCINLFWQDLVLTLWAPDLTGVEAALAAALLRFFGIAAAQSANIITLAGGGVVVLAPCSVLPGLSAGLLVWAIVTRYLAPDSHGRWARLALLASAVIMLNTGRLALMATSAPLYWALHGPVGSTADNLLVIILSFLISAMGGGHARDEGWRGRLGLGGAARTRS